MMDRAPPVRVMAPSTRWLLPLLLVGMACLSVPAHSGRTMHGLPQRPEDLLHAAVRDGTDLPLIQELIDIGTDINDGGYEDGGRTPLHWACFKGRLEIATMLVKAGADINAQDAYGSSALSFAVNAKSAAQNLTALLIEAGADVNLAAEDGKNSPPLHFALIAGKEDMARMLVEAGADCNFGLVNKLYGRKGGLFGPGSTPLHLALGEGMLEVAKLMLASGADPSLRNEEGEIPIDRVLPKIKDEATALLALQKQEL